jgi:hypothetical protein
MLKTGDARPISDPVVVSTVTDRDEAYFRELRGDDADLRRKIGELLSLPPDVVGKDAKIIWKVL